MCQELCTSVVRSDPSPSPPSRAGELKFPRPFLPLAPPAHAPAAAADLEHLSDVCAHPSPPTRFSHAADPPSLPPSLRAGRGDRGCGSCNPPCCRKLCTCGFDEDDERHLAGQNQRTAPPVGEAGSSTVGAPAAQTQPGYGPSRMIDPTAQQGASMQAKG